MARHNRRFPLGTQYLFTPLEVDPLRVRGQARFELHASGIPAVVLPVRGTATMSMAASGFLGIEGQVPGTLLEPLYGELLSEPLYVGVSASEPLYIAERKPAVRRINRRNDYVIVRRMRVLDDSTGTRKPATGLAPGLVGLISTTPDGSAIHPTLQVTLTEREDEPGTYFGKLQGNDLDSHLAALDGQLVYERVHLNGTDYDDYTALLVEGPQNIL